MMLLLLASLGHLANSDSLTPAQLRTQRDSTVQVTGEAKVWHKITLLIPNGPSAMETSNVFLSYRLSASFSQDGESTVEVPGFFDADRDPANSGASSGSVWKVHFCPRNPGQWQYRISFRSGFEVAIETAAGSSVAGIDGATGAFHVAPTDKSGRDFRGKGMLLPDREGDSHYLRHDNG
jgi:hypothetical protein